MFYPLRGVEADVDWRSKRFLNLLSNHFRNSPVAHFSKRPHTFRVKSVELRWLRCIFLETAIFVSFWGCLHFHVIAACIEGALSVLHMLLFSVILRRMHGHLEVLGLWPVWPSKTEHCLLHEMEMHISHQSQLPGWAGHECVGSWAFLTLALTLIHFRVWQRQLRHFTGCNVDRAQQAGQAPLLLRVLIMQHARTMALWGKWLRVWQCTGHKAGAGCISKRLSASCLFEIHRLT